MSLVIKATLVIVGAIAISAIVHDGRIQGPYKSILGFLVVAAIYSVYRFLMSNLLG